MGKRSQVDAGSLVITLIFSSFTCCELKKNDSESGSTPQPLSPQGRARSTHCSLCPARSNKPLIHPQVPKIRKWPASLNQNRGTSAFRRGQALCRNQKGCPGSGVASLAWIHLVATSAHAQLRGYLSCQVLGHPAHPARGQDAGAWLLAGVSMPGVCSCPAQPQPAPTCSPGLPSPAGTVG